VIAPRRTGALCRGWCARPASRWGRAALGLAVGIVRRHGHAARPYNLHSGFLTQARLPFANAEKRGARPSGCRNIARCCWHSVSLGLVNIAMIAMAARRVSHGGGAQPGPREIENSPIGHWPRCWGRVAATVYLCIALLGFRFFPAPSSESWAGQVIMQGLCIIPYPALAAPPSVVMIAVLRCHHRRAMDITHALRA